MKNVENHRTQQKTTGGQGRLRKTIQNNTKPQKTTAGKGTSRLARDVMKKQQLRKKLNHWKPLKTKENNTNTLKTKHQHEGSTRPQKPSPDVKPQKTIGSHRKPQKATDQNALMRVFLICKTAVALSKSRVAATSLARELIGQDFEASSVWKRSVAAKHCDDLARERARAR